MGVHNPHFGFGYRIIQKFAQRLSSFLYGGFWWIFRTAIGVNRAVHAYGHGTAIALEVLIQRVFEGRKKFRLVHSIFKPQVPIHSGNLAVFKIECVRKLVSSGRGTRAERRTLRTDSSGGTRNTYTEIPTIRMQTNEWQFLSSVGGGVSRAAMIQLIRPKKIAAILDPVNPLFDAAIVNKSGFHALARKTVIVIFQKRSSESDDLISLDIRFLRLSQMLDAKLDFLFPLLYAVLLAVRMCMGVNADLMTMVNGFFPGLFYEIRIFFPLGVM